MSVYLTVCQSDNPTILLQCNTSSVPVYGSVYVYDSVCVCVCCHRGSAWAKIDLSRSNEFAAKVPPRCISGRWGAVYAFQRYVLAPCEAGARDELVACACYFCAFVCARC